MDFLCGRAELDELLLHRARDSDDGRSLFEHERVRLCMLFENSILARIVAVKVYDERNVQATASSREEHPGRPVFGKDCARSRAAKSGDVSGCGLGVRVFAF